jgi:hypothetical protein
MDLRAKLKEYIEETEHQGPEISSRFGEQQHEYVWEEIKKFVEDFVIFCEESEKEG